MNDIPFCGYMTFCLCSHQYAGNWVALHRVLKFTNHHRSSGSLKGRRPKGIKYARISLVKPPVRESGEGWRVGATVQASDPRGRDGRWGRAHRDVLGFSQSKGGSARPSESLQAKVRCPGLVSPANMDPGNSPRGARLGANQQ